MATKAAITDICLIKVATKSMAHECYLLKISICKADSLTDTLHKDAIFCLFGKAISFPALDN